MLALIAAGDEGVSFCQRAESALTLACEQANRTRIAARTKSSVPRWFFLRPSRLWATLGWAHAMAVGSRPLQQSSSCTRLLPPCNYTHRRVLLGDSVAISSVCVAAERVQWRTSSDSAVGAIKAIASPPSQGPTVAVAAKTASRNTFAHH